MRSQGLCLAPACACLPSCLQVHHPTVEQLVAVAAHSFTAADLLRVERILLDTLDFNITLPTPYSFLHLLTQVGWLQATIVTGEDKLLGGALLWAAGLQLGCSCVHWPAVQHVLQAMLPVLKLSVRVLVV